MDRRGPLPPPWTAEDRAAFHHLVSRYGAPELLALLRPRTAPPPLCVFCPVGPEVRAPNAPADATQDAPDPALLSRANVLRTDAARLDGTVSRVSLISSASSGSVFSDVSSAAGSAGPDAERRPAGFHHPGDGHHRRAAGRAASRPPTSASRSSTSAGTPRDGPFECPFCAEAGISRSIARKSDLKRHFLQFHHANARWTCSLPGCGLTFDWKSAYELHLKDVHRGVHRDDPGVETCPQVVFACGFSSCKQVYEARCDVDAGAKATEYFAHVAGHFHSGDPHQRWSYTDRLRNLMRQAKVDEAWKSRVRGHGPNDRLKWHPQSSSTLRKMLETRHFPDIHLLVRWAVILGSAPHSALPPEGPELPRKLAVPERRHCYMVAFDHFCEEPSDAPDPGAEGGLLRRHGDVFGNSRPAFSSPPTPGAHESSGLHAVDFGGTHRLGLYLAPEGEVPDTVAALSPSFPPGLAMPPASEALEGVGDASVPVMAGSQHPLSCYHGYSQTSMADLPSARDVIADIDRKLLSKSQSPDDVFHGGTLLPYAGHHGPLAQVDDADLTFDVEMTDSCPPYFYLVS